MLCFDVTEIVYHGIIELFYKFLLVNIVFLDFEKSFNVLVKRGKSGFTILNKVLKLEVARVLVISRIHIKSEILDSRIGSCGNGRRWGRRVGLVGDQWRVRCV